MTTKPVLTPALVGLMAFATGLAVASNYYAQPLLQTLATTFGITLGAAGFIVTAAQLGYAVGLVLLVPLGDLLERRKLIVGMTVLAALGLLITGSANHIGMVLLGTALTALLSVVAQILLPFAATLAEPEQRGKVVGTIMSGLLLGILLARTVAGLLAGLGGWRTVYWVAAPLLLLTAVALWRALPEHKEANRLSYPQLLASVWGLMVEFPQLRLRALLGGLSFAIFSVLWTPMAFLLSAPPYHFSEAMIGLFGLVGAAGALAARQTGHWADRGHAERSTLWGLGSLLLSWLPIAFAPSSIIAFIIGILVLDFAVQAIHVSNQSVIYKLRPEARSRITSAYMTSYFIGGASGSLLSALAYAHAGWLGVSVLGAGLSAVGLAVYLLARRPKEIVQAKVA
ncbi:Predicted arabinose efflux permease, MFS family [Andreprevotia lacus DSM 23236]|jgi:predicted MFS family arabinose efflux permease|uniref:Predicted arabinose efflux permease, MFS family n=1 Tax=Andreprevotia lacus DSM 23236 TaxID=1121001 RepID=A0A1W1XSR8_9NEIS|nr:MFS transporter [Andreprevotia lacus]SMC26578.1 Predicted arabinose efflux permease, MFS family [Andreprevotia lacus DSM 23236]